MAEALLRRQLHDADMAGQVQVRSAGVWAQEGRPASTGAVAVMAERGLDIHSHRAHTLTSEDMAEADLVLVMSREHLDYLRSMWPQYTYKVKRLSAMAGKRRDIADPYGMPHQDYRDTADEIEAYLEKGLHTILKAL
jgi:protein-tyrosine phosphatase